MPVDILAIAAHRDDVELTCAGTLLKAADAGYQTAILDLTAGETGTRGSATLRAEEADRAAKILCVAERRNAGLPDAHLHNSDEARRAIVAQIRHFAPRVVILPFPVGRHPDHRVASELGRDACYLAGLARYESDGEPHRPHKLLYALSYREDPIKPTFVVDITQQFARKLAAIRIGSSNATALFLAICTDTGWFQFSNTRPQTLRLAARLLSRLSGGPPEPRWITAPLTAPLKTNGPREFYQPAVLSDAGVLPLEWKGSADVFTLAAANALLGPTSEGKPPRMENLPGAETGPGQVGTQGKATADNVNAFVFKWDRAGNSSKHITFDWSGPDAA